MGWNSFDCWGSSVTEAQMRANADVFAKRLKPAGYEYVVLDYCWSHPSPGAVENPNQSEAFEPRLAMDDFGRLLPALERFPSAAHDAGLKPLADCLHAMGLKFGLHIMRGIPRQAVADNTPIEGTHYHAKDIVRPDATCSWLNHMVGIDATTDAGQAYYDSIMRLYAHWGVDYIKADDMLFSEPSGYSAGEIEAVRKAIDRCGRPMLLSLSPGRAPIEQAEHLRNNANLWRMSQDFWDRWSDIEHMVELCNAWSPHVGNGCWPDADMLPLGPISLHGPYGEPRTSRFTPDEIKTLMTLWCVFRSPLMMGGHLPDTDEATLQAITNPRVLHVHKHGRSPRMVRHQQQKVVWQSNAEHAGRYVALMNLANTTQAVEATWMQLQLTGPHTAHDLWTNTPMGTQHKSIQATLAPHASTLIELKPA